MPCDSRCHGWVVLFPDHTHLRFFAIPMQRFSSPLGLMKQFVLGMDCQLMK